MQSQRRNHRMRETSCGIESNNSSSRIIFSEKRVDQTRSTDIRKGYMGITSYTSIALQLSCQLSNYASRLARRKRRSSKLMQKRLQTPEPHIDAAMTSQWKHVNVHLSSLVLRKRIRSHEMRKAEQTPSSTISVSASSQHTVSISFPLTILCNEQHREAAQTEV